MINIRKFKFGDKITWKGRKAIFISYYTNYGLKGTCCILTKSRIEDVCICNLKKGWKD